MFTLKTNASMFKKNQQNKRYKVLLNAGGGVYGYIITYLMSQLEQDIYAKIDVAAGTSIGGILTLLYSVNNDYKWINSLFQSGVEEIFSKKFFGGIIGSKYDNQALKKFIKKIVGDYKLSDIKRLNDKDLKVIIPTLDFTLSQPRVFDNINLTKQNDLALADIALATSAAPTYFPALDYIWKNLQVNSLEQLMKKPVNEQIYMLTKQLFELQQQQKTEITQKAYKLTQSVLVDGGVIQNIPVVTTYTTLRSELGIQAKDIDMFVIGTGDDCSTAMYSAKDINKWTCFDWLLKFLIPYVTQSNETTSIYWGSLFGFNSFCYFNPLKVSGSLDDIKQLPELKQKCDVIKDDFKKEIYNFLNK